MRRLQDILDCIDSDVSKKDLAHGIIDIIKGPDPGNGLLDFLGPKNIECIHQIIEQRDSILLESGRGKKRSRACNSHQVQQPTTQQAGTKFTVLVQNEQQPTDYLEQLKESIDLHCVTLEESKGKLVQRICECAQYIRKHTQLSTIQFAVITGRHGHRSVHEGANLQLEIKRYLKEQRINYQTDQYNQGQIYVCVNKDTGIQ